MENELAQTDRIRFPQMLLCCYVRVVSVTIRRRFTFRFEEIVFQFRTGLEAFMSFPAHLVIGYSPYVGVIADDFTVVALHDFLVDEKRAVANVDPILFVVATFRRRLLLVEFHERIRRRFSISESGTGNRKVSALFDRERYCSIVFRIDASTTERVREPTRR